MQTNWLNFAPFTLYTLKYCHFVYYTLLNVLMYKAVETSSKAYKKVSIIIIFTFCLPLHNFVYDHPTEAV